MPVKPQDTKHEKSARPNNTRYGKNQSLNFHSDADETDEQEYKKNGLPKTSGYSASKD